MEMDTTNRPDEWMIEQGMAGHKLPILDQSGSDTINLYPPNPTKLMKDEEAIRSVGDRDKLFARERSGWKGYFLPSQESFILMALKLKDCCFYL